MQANKESWNKFLMAVKVSVDGGGGGGQDGRGVENNRAGLEGQGVVPGLPMTLLHLALAWPALILPCFCLVLPCRCHTAPPARMSSSSSTSGAGGSPPPASPSSELGSPAPLLPQTVPFQEGVPPLLFILQELNIHSLYCSGACHCGGSPCPALPGNCISSLLAAYREGAHVYYALDQWLGSQVTLWCATCSSSERCCQAQHFLHAPDPCYCPVQLVAAALKQPLMEGLEEG